MLYIEGKVTLNARAGPVLYIDKKKIKFSSYIRKFTVEQLQSHI
jgi:hypothetical protein